MKFGYTILYVTDVSATLNQYVSAFGFKKRMLHESGLYGELETGDTVLGFAAHEMAEMNDIAMRPADPKDLTCPVNITFVTPDVQVRYDQAIANGATAVMQPKEKPWGQVCCYVRDRDGHLIEIASPIIDQYK